MVIRAQGPDAVTGRPADKACGPTSVPARSTGVADIRSLSSLVQIFQLISLRGGKTRQKIYLCRS